MYGFFVRRDEKKVAVIERWLLSEVQLYQRIPNMVVLPMMEH